jgi:hypothetical protein
MTKPILCLDFDGVIHSYSSGWKGASVIPDPPVAGAMEFIRSALDHFRVAIFSSRSNQPGGLQAMKDYIALNSELGFHDPIEGLEWPLEKPAAFVTIDDRALTFDGTWPDLEALKTFQPWNKRDFGATGTFPQGVLNDDDQGALKIGIAYDKSDGLVHLNFGKPVAWTAFPPEMAVNLARMLLKHAGAKTVEIGF